MRGTAVLRHGVLHGMQQQANCDVLVHMRQTGSEPEFTEGFVLNAPPALPDGEYLVCFERHTMHTRKDKGRWLYSNEIEGSAAPSQAESPIDDS